MNALTKPRGDPDMTRITDPETALHHQDLPDTDRRNLLKLTGATVAVLGAESFLKSPSASAKGMPEEWDKVFP